MAGEQAVHSYVVLRRAASVGCQGSVWATRGLSRIRALIRRVGLYLVHAMGCQGGSR